MKTRWLIAALLVVGCSEPSEEGPQCVDVASGEVRRSPAPVGIATYPARIQSDWIEAELED